LIINSNLNGVVYRVKIEEVKASNCNFTIKVLPSVEIGGSNTAHK